jgi:cbb3-type cytochrome oxidase subunit 3
MLSLLLLLFGELKKLMYLLPVFVPLLWWTFRQAARNRKEAERNRRESDVHSNHNPPA